MKIWRFLYVKIYCSKLPPPQRNNYVTKISGFTLAELLITLGIIGVVATLTMGNLIPNLEKIKTEAKLKKFYNVIAQATDRAMLVHEDWSTWDYSLSSTEFFERYYKEQLQDVQVLCMKNSKLQACGKSDNYMTRYLIFKDGTCAKFRKNSDRESIHSFYWNINTSCYQKSIGGRTEFELGLLNFKDMKYRCNYTPAFCTFPGDEMYEIYKSYYNDKNYRPDNTPDKIKDLCQSKQGSLVWESYGCYYRFVAEGMQFSKNYYFFKK